MERGERTWAPTLLGLSWLSANGFSLNLAGRTCWGESEVQAREGYARLIAAESWRVNANDPMQLVLFPEMDESVDVPEITTACWGILDQDPAAMMCASSRMVVKRKGAQKAAVVACTLLPYDPQFELGETLAEASGAGAAEPSSLRQILCARRRQLQPGVGLNRDARRGAQRLSEI